MNPEQRDLVYSLMTVPGQPEPISKDEFLRRFGESDGRRLGMRLVREAAVERSGVDLEYALIVASLFGVPDQLVQPLCDIFRADWHIRHEEIIRILAELRTVEAIPTLIAAAQWAPEYMAKIDHGRSMARKAIYGLGAIPGPQADSALRALLHSDNGFVASRARAQLERRAEE
jgi:hypothetical protein